MVIFLYNKYIFGIQLQIVLYPKLFYNEECHKWVCMYIINTVYVYYSF